MLRPGIAGKKMPADKLPAELLLELVPGTAVASDHRD